MIEVYLNPETWQEWIVAAGSAGPIVFISLYAVATLLFLPGTPLSVVAGVLFGSVMGTVYVVIGATIGAAAAFLVARYLAGNWITNFVEKKVAGLDKYNKKLADNGLMAVLFFRLIPLFPFNGLNFGLGLTRVSFRDYFVGTLLGIIPGTFVYVYLGGSLASLNIGQIVSAIGLLAALIVGVKFLQKTGKKLDENEFDVIIIGAGSGGLNVAGFMNKAGFKVLLIDKSDEAIGGDCLNFGCVPSKALINVARKVQSGKWTEQFGTSLSGKPDMKLIGDFIKGKQMAFRKHENAEWFESQGMTVKLGEAEFASQNEVRVNDEVYRGKKIVVATGSRPRRLEVPGSEQVKIYDNENIFDIDWLPEKLLVIGGGPIGLELGQAFSYLGSEVTFVVRDEKLLPREDKDVAGLLQTRLIEQGMRFIFESEIKEFKNSRLAVVEDMLMHKHEIEFDAVLVAIGRELNVEGLNWSKAGIDVKDGRVPVNKKLETSNKDVLLCGDIVGQHQFTHAAELHAGVIINNFFSPINKKLSTDKMSWVTFTDPEIATFGLSREELIKRKQTHEIIETDFLEDDRAIISDYPLSLLKIFVTPKGKILGGTMIAPNAGELAQELMLAVSSGLTVKDLFNKIYPYPTASRINKRAITKHMAGKLNAKTKAILKLLFR